MEDIIDEEQQKRVISKLHEILRPFLLRRMKKDVLLRMPPKLEIVVYCHMSKLQAEYYNRIQDNTLLETLLALGIDIRDITGGASSSSLSTKSTNSSFKRSSSNSSARSMLEDSNTNEDGTTNTNIGSIGSNKLMQLRKVCNHPFLFGEPVDHETGQYIGEQMNEGVQYMFIHMNCYIYIFISMSV